MSKNIALTLLLVATLLFLGGCNLNFSFDSKDEEIIAEGERQVSEAKAAAIDQDTDDKTAIAALRRTDEQEMREATRPTRVREENARQRALTMAVLAVVGGVLLVCLGVSIYTLQKGALKPGVDAVKELTAPRVVTTEEGVPVAVAASPLEVLQGVSSVTVAELPGAQHATAQIESTRALASAAAQAAGGEQRIRVIDSILGAIRPPRVQVIEAPKDVPPATETGEE